MDQPKVTKRYRVSAAAMIEAASFIDTAIDDASFGSAVKKRMPSTFPAEYKTSLADLVEALRVQSQAFGAANVATKQQGAAGATCRKKTGTARAIAKLVFTGENELLHSSFAVGGTGPKRVPIVLARAEKVHAACLTHAAKLESRGWNADSTVALAAAITALNAAESAQHLAQQERKRATDTLVSRANAVYELIRAVQIIADAEYPADRAATDPTIRNARGLFLLGVFPPRRGATPAQPENSRAASNSSPIPS